MYFYSKLLSSQRALIIGSLSNWGAIMNDIYLIKDLSRISGFSIHTIKYYLKIGLIKEIGRSPETSFRYFNNTNLEQLKKIRQYRRENKSISQIKQLLYGGA